MYTGWSDAGISALATIDYYERVLEHDPSAIEDVRLIMMPGVDHCFGGVGPAWVNHLDEIDKWVETSKAPPRGAASAESGPREWARWLDCKQQVGAV